MATNKDKTTDQAAGETATDQATDQVAQNDTPAKDMPKEIGGRGGLEPTRYGDWEKDGIISDF